MFPDPRRRRPRFEFPGSTGAGPRHHVRMLSNLSVLLLLLLERGCADQEYMAGNQTSWVHTMFCFYLWKFRQVNSPCFSFLIYKMRTVRDANRIYNKWVITWKKKIYTKLVNVSIESNSEYSNTKIWWCVTSLHLYKVQGTKVLKMVIEKIFC